MKTISGVVGCAASALMMAAVIVMGSDERKTKSDEEPFEVLPAVIDVKSLLRNHVGLEYKLTNLLNEAEEFAKETAQQRTVITAKHTLRDSCEADSPDHKRLSTGIARAEEELRSKVKEKKLALRRRESTIYADTYREIQEKIGEFSNKHGISLVITYESVPHDKDYPEDIERGILSPAIYHKNRDITPHIQMMINADATDEEKAVRKSSIFNRPMKELRATGLRFPFHKTVKRMQWGWNW